MRWHSQDGTSTLVVDPDDTHVEQYTATSAPLPYAFDTARHAAVSDDGRWVAILSDEDRPHVHIFHFCNDAWETLCVRLWLCGIQQLRWRDVPLCPPELIIDTTDCRQTCGWLWVGGWQWIR